VAAEMAAAVAAMAAVAAALSKDQQQPTIQVKWKSFVLLQQ